MAANEPEFSKSGVFFDTESRKVVKSQPTEGIQLVAPGSEIDDNARAVIESYSTPDEVATAPADVETSTVKSTATRRKG